MDRLHRLKSFTRTTDANPAAYSPNAALPPRELFTGNAELIAAYDALVHYQGAVREQQRLAATKRDQANAAAQKYRADIADAVTAGKDTTKVKNDEPRLLAEAEAHQNAEATAKRQAVDAGRTLGELMQQHGADYFVALEQQMTEAAEEITAQVSALRTAWNTWAEAWSVREHLAKVVHAGGSQLYWRGVSLPTEIESALATVADTLGDLDRLKTDEADLAAWREQQAAVHEKNKRILASRGLSA